MTIMCKECKATKQLVCNPGKGGALIPRACTNQAAAAATGGDPCGLDPLSSCPQRASMWTSRSSRCRSAPLRVDLSAGLSWSFTAGAGQDIGVYMLRGMHVLGSRVLAPTAPAIGAFAGQARCARTGSDLEQEQTSRGCGTDVELQQTEAASLMRVMGCRSGQRMCPQESSHAA